MIIINLWSNVQNFKPYSLFTRKLDFCWRELVQNLSQIGAGKVSSRHTLMPAANSHPNSLISQQLAVLRSDKCGGWSGCRKNNAHSYGSWCSVLRLLVVCQQVQRQRRTRQKDWTLRLSICLISVLFWKIIFIVMSPKTTSPFKQESWVSQHVPKNCIYLKYKEVLVLSNKLWLLNVKKCKIIMTN